MTARRRVFVDVETTGLDPQRHQITEVAWYDLSTGCFGTFVAPHTLENADETALEISGYWKRIAGRAVVTPTHLKRFHDLLGGDTTPTTLAICNPSFDVPMLSAMFSRLGIPNSPWHHRKLDISNLEYALHPERWDNLPGLAEICKAHNIALPNHHTALNDVLAGVRCLRELDAERAALTRAAA